MAQVQFVNQTESIRITRGMHAPTKRVDESLAWFLEAQKTIREIPTITSEYDAKILQSGWYIFYQEVSLDFVKFELHDALDNKCHVVIDRKKSALTTNI